ncbi:TetR/AcrR family transcriptional regulator [Paenibacillus sp. S150]|uniref:TetR/AcrR family transcriptional regulator n=1 Tax=Paenibacillus sp. S150 TaxID=2749826 RepID=UPI001C58EC65|nr:TetR/AcrR family transcriptional regulator [Paenibacillus sp. S150]MBW4080814.1 TetR/AcrR family transcriptional regulator [Paenibacillus sp. S150]
MTRTNNIADHPDKDTKQTILEVTVDLIRGEGFSCATMRNIATRAGINLALVNYHYGSKEKLLADAVRALLSTFNDAFKVLEDDTLPPRERLKQFFIRYIEELQRYPGLARQMLDQRHHVMGSLDEYTRYCKMMRIEKILQAIQEITGEQDKNKLITMQLQIYGAVVFPMITISSLPKDNGNFLPFANLPPIGEQIDELFGRYFH